MSNIRSVVAGSGRQGVFRLDKSGRLTYVDGRTAEIFGYAPGEMVGRNFPEFFCGEGLPQAQANFAQRRLGIGGVAEYPMRRRDGTARWVAVASAPTYDAEEAFFGVTGFVTDVSEQRQQQEFFAHEHRMLRLLAGNQPLEAVLDDLCLTLEALSPRPLQAAVMRAERITLKCVAAPNLPPRFRADRAVVRLDGDHTPCAAAVRSGREVIIGDTTSAAVAPEVAALHRNYGFAAAWSYPIVQDGETLGTLALFLPTPGEPDAEVRHAIEFAAQVARLALTHERKAAALRQSEQRFQDYTDLSADWYWEQDTDFRFTSMSGGVFNKGGFRIADSLGRTRWDLPIESVSETQWAEHRGLLERHEAFQNFTYSIRAADGSLRWYSVSGKPVFTADGGFFGYRGTSRDITEQVNSREQLAKALRWLEQAIRAADIGLWERDIDTWTFCLKDNWRALFGYAEDEIRNATEDFNRLVHPDDLARIHAAGLAYVANPQREFEIRFRIRHKDGSWRWVLSRGNVMNEPVTGRRTFVGCHLDVTEQIQAEQKVTELAAMLEARVKARTAELEEANRELDAFNFSVSHDLRTPLRAIEGFSRALLEDCDEKLDPTGREYLRRICRSTARMGELIDALYGLSRMSRASLRLGPVDLSAMARELVAELREQDPRRAVEIEITETPLVEGDSHLLRIVLTNLIDNAWKFTGKALPARIAFGARRDEECRVTYFLRDNGVGFDMQFADKLFRIFHRLHREEEFPGQGVGLTTVQRIIARHGGRVWGEAARDAGACFHFTLWTDSALLADALANLEDQEVELR